MYQFTTLLLKRPYKQYDFLTDDCSNENHLVKKLEILIRSALITTNLPV